MTHELTVPATADILQAEAVLHECHFPGGMAASAMDGEFGASRFTRDYLAVMGDLMYTHPTLVREGFSQIPQEQGIDFDPVTDQQPGRFSHQVAYNQWGGLRVPAAVVAGREYWADQWGVPFDAVNGFVVWNQTDGTRYVHELRRYVDAYGPAVLGDEFIHRPTGEVRTVRQATLLQLDWMVRTVENSSLGLLEVQEFNPNQTSWSGVMRDGYNSYFHPVGESGLVVNKDRPIAYIENQGLAVQAFLDAAQLFKDSDDPAIKARVSTWQDLARELPRRTLTHFRWDEANTLVPAVDRDAQGRPRQVRLISSAVAETLATPELYRGMTTTDIDPRDLLRGVILRSFSPDSMTPAGVRMLDLRHSAQEGPGYAYQGTRTVWPVTQWRIASGLEGLQMPTLARALREPRTLAALRRAGGFPEGFYVSPDGVVGYRQATNGKRPSIEVPAEQDWSNKQAWTASGARAALAAQQQGGPAETGWQKAVVAEALASIKDVPDARTGETTTYALDQETGKRVGRERAQAMGGMLLG